VYNCGLSDLADEETRSRVESGTFSTQKVRRSRKTPRESNHPQQALRPHTRDDTWPLSSSSTLLKAVPC